MRSISLNEIIEQIKDLPPLPQSVHKIMEITNSPDASAKDLAAILETDPSLTTKVLRMANSSYYGFSREISTLSHAVMCLGFSTVKSIALTASTQKVLTQEIPSYEMEKGMLWEHSIASATAARIIALKINYKDVEEAYIAGLLHDIGKIMLDRYAHDLFKQITNMVNTGDIPFNVAELDILGFDHALIGSKIIEKWNLPITLVESTQFHHEPNLAKENQKLTYITHLADTISGMIGIGMGSDGLKYIFQPETFEVLGLNEKDIETIIETLTDQIDEINVAY